MTRNTESLFDIYKIFDKLVERLKNVFSSDVTREHIINCADSFETMINKRVDDKIKDSIGGSDLVTKDYLKYKIESVRADVRHDISKIFNKVLWVFCTGFASTIVAVILSHLNITITR